MPYCFQPNPVKSFSAFDEFVNMGKEFSNVDPTLENLTHSCHSPVKLAASFPLSKPSASNPFAFSLENEHSLETIPFAFGSVDDPINNTTANTMNPFFSDVIKTSLKPESINPFKETPSPQASVEANLKKVIVLNIALF